MRSSGRGCIAVRHDNVSAVCNASAKKYSILKLQYGLCKYSSRVLGLSTLSCAPGLRPGTALQALCALHDAYCVTEGPAVASDMLRQACRYRTRVLYHICNRIARLQTSIPFRFGNSAHTFHVKGCVFVK